MFGVRDPDSHYYAFYLAVTPRRVLPWSREGWTQIVSVLNPLVSKAHGRPGGKAEWEDYAEPSFCGAMSFRTVSRIAWSRAGHAKWTLPMADLNGKTSHRPLQFEMWAPSRGACRRVGAYGAFPDIRIEILGGVTPPIPACLLLVFSSDVFSESEAIAAATAIGDVFDTTCRARIGCGAVGAQPGNWESRSLIDFGGGLYGAATFEDVLSRVPGDWLEF